jgi:hypothetical protein
MTVSDEKYKQQIHDRKDEKYKQQIHDIEFHISEETNPIITNLVEEEEDARSMLPILEDLVVRIPVEMASKDERISKLLSNPKLSLANPVLERLSVDASCPADIVNLAMKASHYQKGTNNPIAILFRNSDDGKTLIFDIVEQIVKIVVEQDENSFKPVAEPNDKNVSNF